MTKDPRQRFQTVRGFQRALQNYLEHRESSKIASEAQQKLDRCQAEVKELYRLNNKVLTGLERNHFYLEYSETVAGYRQALLLWSGNDVATFGKDEAHICFARTALDQGDLGLAQSQAAQLDQWRPQTGELIADIQQQVMRVKRGRLFSWIFGIALAVLATASFFGLIFGLISMNHARNVAERKSNEASLARELAEKRQKQALIAIATAKENWLLAQKEKVTAEEARKEAEKQRRKAEQAMLQEEEQRKLVEKREKLAKKRAEIAKESLDNLINRITESSRSKGLGSRAVTGEAQVKLLEIALKGLEKLRQTDVQSAAVSPAVMKAHSQMGEAYYFLAKYKDSVKAYKQAIKVGQQLIEKASDEALEVCIFVASSFRGLGKSYNVLGETVNMQKAYSQAFELLARLKAPPGTKLTDKIQTSEAMAKLELAVFYYQRRAHDKAEPYFKDAINKLRPIVAKNSNDPMAVQLALAYLYLGLLRSQESDFQEALKNLGAAEQLWRRLAAQSRSSNRYYRYYWALTLHDLAVAEWTQDSHLSAISHLEKSVQQLGYLVNDLKMIQYKNHLKQYRNKLAQWRRLLR
jgi:hypothetical protein